MEQTLNSVAWSNELVFLLLGLQVDWTWFHTVGGVQACSTCLSFSADQRLPHLLLAKGRTARLLSTVCRTFAHLSLADIPVATASPLAKPHCPGVGKLCHGVNTQPYSRATRTEASTQSGMFAASYRAWHVLGRAESCRLSRQALQRIQD